MSTVRRCLVVHLQVPSHTLAMADLVEEIILLERVAADSRYVMMQARQPCRDVGCRSVDECLIDQRSGNHRETSTAQVGGVYTDVQRRGLRQAHA